VLERIEHAEVHATKAIVSVVLDVHEAAERWSLALGEPYVQGAAGYTVRATTDDATPVVLKIVHPHRESEHEADALEAWDGNGAIRLLDRDESGCALVLERCDPGTPLAAIGQDAALDVLIGLLPRLWITAAEPFHTLADEAAWWYPQLPRTKLGDAAREAIETLAHTQGEQVLLHQDLHGDNVLAAQREAWLAIDPKPLVGEREFGIAALVRGPELGHGEREVRHRLDRLTAELGLDRERAKGWAIGQTIAWGVAHERHVEVARWLLAC
jgi:streptomycin 6-kinase